MERPTNSSLSLAEYQDSSLSNITSFYFLVDIKHYNWGLKHLHHEPNLQAPKT